MRANLPNRITFKERGSSRDVTSAEPPTFPPDPERSHESWHFPELVSGSLMISLFSQLFIHIFSPRLQSAQIFSFLDIL